MGSGFPAFGADALRFTLATFPPSNKRIALAPKRIEGYRHFANKVWNASRLVLGQLEGLEANTLFTGGEGATLGDLREPVSCDSHDLAPMGFFNKWILAQLGLRCADAGFE